MLMKALENWRNPAVNGVYDEDTVPQITVTNFFKGFTVGQSHLIMLSSQESRCFYRKGR